MSKFDNKEFKSVIRRGYAPYEPVPENIKEVELRGSPAETIKSLAELISETELFLRKTIKEKNPPYLMNMK
jgi:hypothetical protein